MFLQLSPNMLKTFKQCPRKFHYKYVKNISMPVDDDIYEFGKNIHALASYYLRGENTDNFEKFLKPQELNVWNYLKSLEYFSYDVIATEYSLFFKLGDFYYGGRLDALVKKKGKYYILDYKTGKIPQNPIYDFQTMIYILAVSSYYKTSDISFLYLDLKNKKEIAVTFTEALKEEYENRLSEIAGQINSDEFFAKKNNCDCEYSMICC